MPEHAWHPRSHAAFAQVAITHAHINHFNGATRLEGSGDGEHFVATVPTARSYLGRADWAELDASGELRNTEATTSHTLVPQFEQGRWNWPICKRRERQERDESGRR